MAGSLEVGLVRGGDRQKECGGNHAVCSRHLAVTLRHFPRRGQGTRSPDITSAPEARLCRGCHFSVLTPRVLSPRSQPPLGMHLQAQVEHGAPALRKHLRPCSDLPHVADQTLRDDCIHVLLHLEARRWGRGWIPRPHWPGWERAESAVPEQPHRASLHSGFHSVRAVIVLPTER